MQESPFSQMMQGLVPCISVHCASAGAAGAKSHAGLGKTPAEAAGIQVEGSNKWLTIIQNAAHVQTLQPKSGGIQSP